MVESWCYRMVDIGGKKVKAKNRCGKVEMLSAGKFSFVVKVVVDNFLRSFQS